MKHATDIWTKNVLAGAILLMAGINLHSCDIYDDMPADKPELVNISFSVMAANGDTSGENAVFAEGGVYHDAVYRGEPFLAGQEYRIYNEKEVPIRMGLMIKHRGKWVFEKNLPMEGERDKDDIFTYTGDIKIPTGHNEFYAFYTAQSITGYKQEGQNEAFPASFYYPAGDGEQARVWPEKWTGVDLSTTDKSSNFQGEQKIDNKELRGAALIAFASAGTGTDSPVYEHSTSSYDDGIPTGYLPAVTGRLPAAANSVYCWNQSQCYSKEMTVPADKDTGTDKGKFNEIKSEIPKSSAAHNNIPIVTLSGMKRYSITAKNDKDKNSSPEKVTIPLYRDYARIRTFFALNTDDNSQSAVIEEIKFLNFPQYTTPSFMNEDDMTGSRLSGQRGRLSGIYCYSPDMTGHKPSKLKKVTGSQPDMIREMKQDLSTQYWAAPQFCGIYIKGQNKHNVDGTPAPHPMIYIKVRYNSGDSVKTKEFFMPVGEGGDGWGNILPNRDYKVFAIIPEYSQTNVKLGYTVESYQQTDPVEIHFD